MVLDGDVMFFPLNERHAEYERSVTSLSDRVLRSEKGFQSLMFPSVIFQFFSPSGILVKGVMADRCEFLLPISRDPVDHSPSTRGMYVYVGREGGNSVGVETRSNCVHYHEVL